MKPIQSKEEYQEYVDAKSPNSPILKNCFNAFWVGGLICSIGQIIFEICQMRGIDETNSYTIGIIFYAFGKKAKYIHSVWHLFVLLGTILQYISILFFIIIK